ncbi:aminoacyl-tRNA hydrolase [Pseudomonas sp. Leaf58]|uniref:aminoacyl-tRNA hydrolase n=1 Tax=Pseudomonas sp. Leaf58 TaxID=1736226 RepID=UPI00273F7102|nr:aminoacyl-tRNA hydrolase [Pseudomonas sp. Leaf58]
MDFNTIDPKALAELLAGNHPIGNAEDHLYIYAIVPTSLEMPVGKTCPQAGHAYVDSYCAAKETHPELAAQYRDLGKGGSKVALKAKNHRELIVAWGKALEAGLPCALVVDKTHILPPHFDGTPIITALGIGPCTKAEARHIVKKFQCL